MTETAIEIKNLDKKYGNVQVLFGINLNIKKGECLGIVGKNGAGKTTLLECIEGIKQWHNGEILINEKTLKDNRNYLSNVLGVQLQSSSLPNEMKVKEAIALFAAEHGVIEDDRLYAQLDISKLLNKKYSELSTGQKRRLHLLLTILHDPEIVILDEPTAGLDVNGKYLLYDKIDQLKGEDKTILLTSHDMYEIEKLCDRVIFIENGKIMKELTKGNLQNKDKCIIVFKTNKNSLDKLNPLYGQLLNIDKESDEFSFECSNINALLNEIVDYLQSSEDEIINIYLMNNTVEEELIKIMRGDENESIGS